MVLIKMKLTKFGSLNLDTPRISYEFFKFAFKSKKNKKKFKLGLHLGAPSALHPETLTRGPGSQLTPCVSHTEAGACLTGGKLTDDEVSGSAFTPNGFPSLTRTRRTKWLNLYRPLARAAAIMVDGGAAR